MPLHLRMAFGTTMLLLWTLTRSELRLSSLCERRKTNNWDSTTQVFYSEGSTALAAVTLPVANDVSGRGQFHFGMLKKPTGEGLKDVTKEGFQEAGIDEGIIYGGVFEEDSTGGCLSLSA